MFYKMGQFASDLVTAPVDLVDGFVDGLMGYEEVDEDESSYEPYDEDEVRCASCGQLNEDFERSRFCKPCRKNDKAMRKQKEAQKAATDYATKLTKLPRS